VPRAAIVTGASRGIGLALAKALAEEGYELTLSARRPDALEAAAESLRRDGHAVEHVAGNLADADAIADLVARHMSRFGRLDVLVNNAGVGIGAAATEHKTEHVDLQFDVNARSIVLMYRETIELLKTAGAEHRNALVVNLASVAGKSPQPWLSVYSATKAAVIAYTQAMNQELNPYGVKSVAFCPGFVDTDMSDFVKDRIPAEQMLTTSDVAEGLRFLLRVSPNCVIPEIVFERTGSPEPQAR
jgi:NAD(P)-dependent dehydrogenase (short-subunit alcohol dehydrogenase family)